MSRHWWLLPGPEEFVRRASDELREGRNVVLLLPRHLPDGLDAAVRAERFPEGDPGTWTVLTAAPPEGPPPARQVADRFLPSVPPGPLGVSWLAHHEQLGGQTVWVDGLTERTWTVWRDFLAEYAHACRSCPLLDRTVLVAPLVGPATAAPPEEDVALAVLRWLGVVEPLDQLLYVSRLLRGRSIPRVQRDVFAAVVAGLALWDPQVSEALATLPMEGVLHPRAVLEELAARRGWSGRVPDPVARWREGMSDEFDGREQVHSAALAVAGGARGDELSRRVWGAQVGVLLPYVEGRRRELLERLDGQLVGPFYFDDGVVIHDKRELEIGQIEYHLARNHRKVPRLVSLLKQIRNCLAHLEVVGADLIGHNELTRPL